jgi:tRNA(fMet)-specific endonuclease VapC
MRYLLDTNILSDLVRRPQGLVMRRIREVGEAQVCTSIIVAAELRYGAAKRASARLTAQLEAVLGATEVLPFEAPADAVYGLIRARLEQSGQAIGGNDLLIAAQALTLGYTIVTDNEREFARVSELPELVALVAPALITYGFVALRPSEVYVCFMAKVCEFCGRGPQFGNRVSHAHNITKRRWNLNLQTVHALVKGAGKRVRVCTSCIRNGKVQKAPLA